MRRLPALLLGLLALLLWGRCALLFPGVSAPALEGWVSSTDSLRKIPGTLFVTLRLHNTTQEPVTMQEVWGSLRFSNRDFPFSATPALRGQRLLVFEDLTQAVAIPVAVRSDLLRLLRQLLRGPSEPSNRAYLHWQVRYSQAGARTPYLPGRTTSYLPPLAGPR